MELILEVLFELFGEILLQLLFQLFGVVGSHAVAPYKAAGPRSHTLSIISHLLIGAALGGLTLIFWRHSLMTTDFGRAASLVLSPLAAGGASAGLGYLLRKQNKDTVPLERFGYAYLFAFSFALVRFLATM
jgi:hypothetical protein